MGKQRMVRFLIMVPRSLGERFDGMAAKYERSRSEICRVALIKGYPAALAWCRRSPLTVDLDLAGEVDPASLSAPAGRRSRAGSQDSAPLSQDDRSIALDRYAEALLELEPDRTADVFRSLLGAQAAVLGFALAEGASAVDRLVARHFPVEVGGGDSAADVGGGDALGSVPELD